MRKPKIITGFMIPMIKDVPSKGKCIYGWGPKRLSKRIRTMLDKESF